MAQRAAFRRRGRDPADDGMDDEEPRPKGVGAPAEARHAAQDALLATVATRCTGCCVGVGCLVNTRGRRAGHRPRSPDRTSRKRARAHKPLSPRCAMFVIRRITDSVMTCQRSVRHVRYVTVTARLRGAEVDRAMAHGSRCSTWLQAAHEPGRSCQRPCRRPWEPSFPAIPGRPVLPLYSNTPHRRPLRHRTRRRC